MILFKQETEKLEQESTRLEREIDNLRRQKTQLEFVLDAHRPSCQAKISPPHNARSSNLPPTVSSISHPSISRPSTLPITCRSNVLLPASSIDSSVFSFDTAGSLIGLTPFLNLDDLSSPSNFLLSPSTLIAQWFVFYWLNYWQQYCFLCTVLLVMNAIAWNYWSELSYSCIFILAPWKRARL